MARKRSDLSVLNDVSGGQVFGADGITASGPGCNPQGTGVGCDVKGTKVEIHVALGDGNDEILPQYDPARLVPAVVNGGPHGSEAHMGCVGVKQSGTGWRAAGIQSHDGRYSA